MRHLILLLSTAVTPAFGQTLTLVTDVPPLAHLARAIGGDMVEVIPLIDATQDPHHVTLRPSQMRSLTQADVIFAASPDLTPWLEKAALAAAPDAQLIWMNEGHGEEDGEEEEHDHAEVHPWLDPEAMTHAAAELAEQLDRLNAGVAAGDRLATVQAKIAQEEASFQTFTTNFKTTGIVAGHDEWGALVEHFGLPIVASVTDSHATLPSPSHLRALNKIVRDLNIRCFVKSPIQDARIFAPVDVPQDDTIIDLRSEVDPLEGDITVLGFVQKALSNCP